MKIKFLSAIHYENPDANNGDCILIDTGSELIIYDCGCEEHAMRVIDYMDKEHYNTAKLVLSHNDSDHFDGIPYLVKKGKISDVYTLLPFMYTDNLLDRINDKRITRESLARRIAEIYDNIYSLSGQVVLRNMFTDKSICPSVAIVGPDVDYALDAIAKQIDGRQSDTIDRETITNAISAQVGVFSSSFSFLLCGDSSYEAIKDILLNYDNIQLPHHGKAESAEQIFAQRGSIGITYYVSDNTGNTNGGSDDLPQKGYHILNTKDKELLWVSGSQSSPRKKNPYGENFVL